MADLSQPESEPSVPAATAPSSPAAEPPSTVPDPSVRPGPIARTASWSKMRIDQTVEWTLGARETHRSVDVGFLAADRDRRVAAGVLAGGVAYRFFFWILALTLLANGALGFLDGDQIRSALQGLGVDPNVASTIQGSAEPSNVARWWLLVVGLWLTAWTGYLGAKTLVLVHAAVWGVEPPPIRRRLNASLVFTGTVLAIVAAMLFSRWLRGQLPSIGFITTLSVVLVPFVAWLMVSARLPRADGGWMDLVPGAVLVAIGVQALHLFTTFFLGPKLVNATELYGVLGVVSTMLFWLYMTGRLVIGAATLNASLYEHRTRDTSAAGASPADASPPDAAADTSPGDASAPDAAADTSPADALPPDPAGDASPGDASPPDASPAAGSPSDSSPADASP